MDIASKTDMFCRLAIGSVITSDQHDLFCRFLKMKPLVFRGIETEDGYKFLMDCHDRLHKMDITERYGVEFINLHLQGDSKMW